MAKVNDNITWTTERGSAVEFNTTTRTLKATYGSKSVEFTPFMLHYTRSLGHYFEGRGATIPVPSDIAVKIKAVYDDYTAKLVAEEKAKTASFMSTPAGQSWLLSKKMEEKYSDM